MPPLSYRGLLGQLPDPEGWVINTLHSHKHGTMFVSLVHRSGRTENLTLTEEELHDDIKKAQQKLYDWIADICYGARVEPKTRHIDLDS